MLKCSGLIQHTSNVKVTNSLTYTVRGEMDQAQTCFHTHKPLHDHYIFYVELIVTVSPFIKPTVANTITGKKRSDTLS